MMTLRLIAIAGIMLLMLLWFPSRAPAHGVEGTMQPGGLSVACRYSTGEPMSYAKVSLFPPGQSQPFQVGYTDKNGRFCFYPDSLGEWRLTADDGMGHRLEVKVPVTDLKAQNPAPPAPAGTRVADTLGLRVLAGLAVILALSGFLFWYQGLRARRDRDKTKA